MRKTLFLSVSDIRELVGRVGLGGFSALLVEQLRRDFLRWNEFQKSPRTAIHSANGVIELMPISDDKLFAFKCVSGHPLNSKLGFFTIMGFGCLSEVSTGWPLLLTEMTLLTAIRTAATSVLAAQVVANPRPTSLAVIGNGAQSEFQIAAFHAVLGVRSFRLYDTKPEATQRLIRNLSEIPDIDLIGCPSVESAVAGSSIVTTCTASKRIAAIVVPEMIEPGMHINGVGGDCPGKTELDPDVLRSAKVFVELAEQTRIEGDIQLLPPDFPVTELWEVISGHRPGRESAEGVTVFDSVGFSLEDFSTLSLVHSLATELGIGAEIELVPATENPNSLYGLLADSRILPC
jgi:ornithine cyclodeaminase